MWIAWWEDDLVRREILAVGWNRWMTDISQQEVSGGNGGANDCEPLDLADGWWRSSCRGYRTEIGMDNCELSDCGWTDPMVIG